MKSKLLFAGITLLTLSSQTFAQTKRSFCNDANKRAELSMEAVANKGEYYDSNTKEHKYFKGCRFDISWMQKARKVICEDDGDLSEVIIPQYFIYVFDGAADFSAQGALNILPMANLDGSEGDDMGKGHMNGGRFFLKQLRDQNYLNLEETQIQYYASSGFHKRENYSHAKACMKETDNYLDYLGKVKPDFKRPKFISLGFSNGGVNATHMQKDMARKSMDRPVDLAFTLDPIEKAVKFLFVQHTKYRGKKHKATKRFVNLYQTVDHSSWGNLHLRGKPVKNADLNIHITRENSPDSIYKDGAYAHLTMSDSYIVENTFHCEMAKIADNQEAMKSRCVNNPFKSRFSEENLPDEKFDIDHILNLINEIE